MQRLHTIKLRDGTTARLDMRQQTWCLLPDLLSTPAAKRSADHEVITEGSCRIPHRLHLHLLRPLCMQLAICPCQH